MVKDHPGFTILIEERSVLTPLEKSTFQPIPAGSSVMSYSTQIGTCLCVCDEIITLMFLGDHSIKLSATIVKCKGLCFHGTLLNRF